MNLYFFAALILGLLSLIGMSFLAGDENELSAVAKHNRMENIGVGVFMVLFFSSCLIPMLK